MNRFIIPILAFICLAVTSSCDDSKSYAELLADENRAVNKFLVQHRVVDYIPEDSVFEIGENAPFYRIDENSNVYMQVISKGDDVKPDKDDRVYFRFTRYNMFYYIVGDDENNILIGTGNTDSMNSTPTFFIFENYNVEESSQFGTGIQLPMRFLGANAKVNIVIKSQAGPSGDMSYVIPYLYSITYIQAPMYPWH